MPETHEQFQVTIEMSLTKNGHAYDCLVTSPSLEKSHLEQPSNGHYTVWFFSGDFYCSTYFDLGEDDKKN